MSMCSNYRAANWVPVGLTTGRGKDDHTHRVNRSIKEVLAFPIGAQPRRDAAQQVPPKAVVRPLSLL
jgi:hypothetical protein